MLASMNYTYWLNLGLISKLFDVHEKHPWTLELKFSFANIVPQVRERLWLIYAVAIQRISTVDFRIFVCGAESGNPGNFVRIATTPCETLKLAVLCHV